MTSRDVLLTPQYSIAIVKTRHKQLFLFVLILLFVFPPACNAEAAKNKLLVRGDYNYPPYEFLDDGGHPADYNKELTAILDEGLNIIKQTGKFHQIYDKWFGILEPTGISTQKAVLYAGIVLILSLIILSGLLLWFRSLRLQVIRRTRELQQELTAREKAEAELSLRNAILSTQQESSIDGILVVDENGIIIFFNRRFVVMWGIPEEVIESKSDERALQSVLDKLIYPEQFLQKVNYLYEHRHEISRDEITLRDSRTGYHAA